jgi:hypothetical protein
MTKSEFAVWLRGMTVEAAAAETANIASSVLAKAAEVLARPPAKAEPVGLTSLHVTGFCMHNVNVKEQCPACANFAHPTWRMFAVRLPVETRQVYIRAHDRTPGNPYDEAHAGAPEGERGQEGVAPDGQSPLG